MLSPGLRVLLAAVVLQTTAACYPYWTGQRLEERIAALETASREVRDRQDELRRDFESAFAERLRKVDEAVESLSRNATRTTAEVGSQVDDLLRQVQELRGLQEQAKFASEALEKRFAEIDTKLAALGGDKALERLKAQKALADIERPADKQAFFDLAKGYHDRGEWAFSRPLLNEFLQKWKFDDLSPAAQLLLADSFFTEKRYREAIVEYDKLRETWPKCKQLPDALLRLGSSFLELGLKDEARVFFEEAAKFPAQPAGKEAKAKLKELAPKPAPKPAPKSKPKKTP